MNIYRITLYFQIAEAAIDYAFWAKDVIFVIGDGSLEGMHAWLSAYHGAHQSSKYTSLISIISR